MINKNYTPQVNNPQQIEVHPDLPPNLKGGKKQFWLRCHRGEIEQFMADNGPEATRIRYNLSETTLRRFIERRNIDLNISKMSRWDREVLMVARAGDAELRGRINRMEAWIKDVTPAIEIIKALIAAFGEKIQNQLCIKLEEDDDPLKLTKIERKNGDKAKFIDTSHNI